METVISRRGGLVLALLLFLGVGSALAVGTAPAKRAGDDMSSMGRLAQKARAVVVQNAAVKAATLNSKVGNDPGDEEGGGFVDDTEAPAGGQAEVSVAVDATGRHVVIGYNDTRGFALNPLRVSGYFYSDDGGRTFVDGGQLPSPGNDAIGGTLLPQVFGDPDVHYIGACTFIYSSIVVAKYSATTAVQTMGVHRSTDCGHTWEGPFIVTAATNPNGAVDTGGNPLDAADKEFMDVDPETGRVMLTWSNFTPFAAGGVEISSTYTDNILATPPTWTTRRVIAATEIDGQSSVPRFAGRGSNNVYATWRRFPGDITNTIGFARSTDNGVTWSAPVDISPVFKTMDQVLGNDRVNTSPSMAVDLSHGRYAGTIYIVYSNNNLNDGADIALQISRDEGLTFSPPRLINTLPGHDRAQWFPWVTVDRTTGRVHVFYYDQGIAKTGDRTIVSYTFSDDGGRTWRLPLPLAPQFHAGWGNDTGQPNLGDYNQAVAQGGELFAAFGYAQRPPGGFVDGQPSLSMTVPDVVFRRVGFFGIGGITGVIAGSTNVGQGPLLDTLNWLLTFNGGFGFFPFFHPQVTQLLAEDFEGAAPGSLPAGWTAAHGAGANVVPWTTDATFCGGSNAAFHPNANDGLPGRSPARWERLISPAFAVPANASWVLVEFDACYDTEDDPNFNVLAYDGFFLRVTDLTTGHTLRSVLAEAFEDVFLTGNIEHYPKHFPRSSNPAYFEDMSAWAGDSGGVKHVRMLLPGMAGTTAQLRFEFTQDSFGTCADVRPGHTCGVAIDNVKITSIGF